MSQRAVFEVHVPGVSPKEEVRVSGSMRALGEWAVHRSVPMTRRDRYYRSWVVIINRLTCSTDVPAILAQNLLRIYMHAGRVYCSFHHIDR